MKNTLGYKVDLVCYYIALEIPFLDSTDNSLDSANLENYHINFNEDDLDEE
jgi:hypothetical protein